MASAVQRDTRPEPARRIVAPALGAAQRVWLSDLYESNFSAVFRACQRVLHNPEDAADAAHEVFLRAVDSLPGRPGGEGARPWLITVARNHCLDLLRRRKRLGTALLTLGASSDQGLDAEHAVIDRQVVDAVLRQLGLRERQALWQSAVEHRPIAEIAGRLGLKYMAAAQLLHRARLRASVVAAKLAAIFGLYQIGRGARRVSLGLTRMLSLERQAPASGVATVAPLLAAAILPVMLAALVTSSSADQASAPGSISAQLAPASLPKVAVSAPVPPNPIGTAAGANGAVPVGSGIPLPSIGVPLTDPTSVKSAVTALKQAIAQLASHATPPTPSLASPAPTLPGLPKP